MAHTRATKVRSRPPSRNTIARVAPKREFTVESLRASITSIELDKSDVMKTPAAQPKRQAPDAIGCLLRMSDEEDDMTEVTKVAARPKRHAQEPTPKAPATKKHRRSPLSSTTRATRSKTLTSRIKTDSIHSNTGTDTDSKPKHDSNAYHSPVTNTGNHRKNPKMSLISPPLDLLRPYMAFQLSVSGLSGKAYKAAQASMTSVLDAAARLEKGGNTALARAHDSLGHSSSEEGETWMRQGSGAVRKEENVEKPARQKDEDVLPRKQRELNEQTRKRLEQARRRNERRGNGKSAKRNLTTHLSSISTSSSSSTWDTVTEMASDTEVEARYPPNKLLSVSSTTSSYRSLDRSTDSTDTSSEGEVSDVIERYEKNALRRQKARQKRRNGYKRVEHDSESGPEMEMDVARRKELEEETLILADRERGKEVRVDFLPVAW